MKIPRHDDQNTKGLQKTTGKYTRFKLSRTSFILMVLSVFTVAGIVYVVLDSGLSHSQVVDKPISIVLNMADHQQLRSVTISGNELYATSKSGQTYHALKEEGQPITDILRHDNISVTVESGQSKQWLQYLLIVAVLALAGGGFIYFMRQNGTLQRAASHTRSKARRFNETHPSTLFKDVAGVEEAKTELLEIVEFLKYPDRFTNMGARIPKGVLLVGSPGTGKTLLARAVAGEAGVSFYSVSGSEFVEMFVGVGAARVRDLFKEAREQAPCILFIDEIDAVGRQRNGNGMGGNDERDQTLNQLLVEMDGFDKNTNIIVIAATNRPTILDAALLRPGRFDRQVMLDKPDIRGRLAILEVHAKGKPIDKEAPLRELARQTAGFSGADLANVLNEAALLAARREKTLIQKHELDEAVLRVLAGPERKSRVITEAEKAIIAYHEVGHAIVMRSLPGTDPVCKVQAIARGMALGVTIQTPTEDRYLVRRSELLAKMAGAMGGRAAEEIIFDDITTGASQDIEYVTGLARRMVCEFGMSPLGNIAMKAEADGGSSFSQETAGRVDEEIRQLVERAYTTARAILGERKDKLIAIAERLIEVETIDGLELDALLFAA